MQGVRIQGNPTLKESPGQLETETEVSKLGAAESINIASKIDFVYVYRFVLALVLYPVRHPAIHCMLSYVKMFPYETFS